LQLVQSIVNRPEARSVLDISWGDWNLGRQIDWSSVNYLGIDVVANMIKRNIDCFSRDNIAFRCLNGVDGKVAPVDLVIIKDVMQHLSNADVLKMLKNLSKAPRGAHYQRCRLSPSRQISRSSGVPAARQCRHRRRNLSAGAVRSQPIFALLRIAPLLRSSLRDDDLQQGSRPLESGVASFRGKLKREEL
jgi:hypothetical protein